MHAYGGNHDDDRGRSDGICSASQRLRNSQLITIC